MWSNKIFAVVSIMLSFSLGMCSPVQAESNLHIGTLEVHPFTSVEQKYDDNIFLEPEGQENDDWITKGAIGLELNMPLVPEREEDFMFEAKYAAEIIEFWDNSEQGRTDHTASVLTDFIFANDVTLKIQESFRKTADPPNSELTALAKRFRNNADVVIGYEREKIGFDVGYRNIRDDYNGSNNLDKYEHVGTLTGYYYFSPKTSVFGEYNYGDITYDDNDTNSDSAYYQWRIGFKGELGPKLVGVVKAGYKGTSYDEESSEDFTGFTLFGNLVYKFQERSTLNIFGERTSTESTYSTNSYYEANRIKLTLDHKLTEKMSLVGTATYEFNNYPDETIEDLVTDRRKDYVYGASSGLKYEAKKWLSVEVNYEYKQRDSEFATFDYRNNKVIAKATLVF